MKNTWLVFALYGAATLIETAVMWVVIYYAFFTESLWLLPISRDWHGEFFFWSTIIGFIAIVMAMIIDAINLVTMRIRMA